MPSYHMTNTGSARSVGPRRIPKIYTDTAGTQACSRSAAGARRYGLTTITALPTPAPAGTALGPIKAAPPKTPAPGGGGTGGPPAAGPSPASKPGKDE